MITHTVFFSFLSTSNSADQTMFFEAVNQLHTIPGVQNLTTVQQISSKNSYEYGITMEFENEAVYQDYNVHPLHKAFINNYWMKNVKDFLEIDYKIFSTTNIPQDSTLAL